VQGLLLLGRRRAPLVVLAAATAIGVFMIVVGFPVGSASFGAWFAAYAVAVYRPGGTEPEISGALRGEVAVVIAALALGLAGLAPGARGQSGVWGQLTAGALTAAWWVLGYAIHIRRAYVAELKDRATRLEAEEGERAARAVVDERLRIARELHDVIGHSISLISIQSEAAARSARTNPDAVPGFLATISDVSRQALAELRSVLAVLRPDAEAEMSPQPGLAQLEELVARLNTGGLRARLDAEPMDLPPGVGLTVYRIVQESLTNVVKHAGPDATAGVTIVRSDGVVRVSGHDDGLGPSGPVSSTAHGIVGMRERTAVYGGTLHTGARPGGGFEVEAFIPVPEEAR
jgi:signal transduction histidine kinase